MKYRIYYIAVLLFIIVNLNSQSKEIKPNILFKSSQKKFIQENGNLPILKIIFIGNDKTKEKVLKSCLPVLEGAPFSSFNNDKVIQNLYSLKIIKDVKVSFIKKENGVFIIIKIEEKHTFIPLPLVMKNEDNFLIGILGMESNLLGYNKKLIFGAFYTNLGWNSMVMLDDPGLKTSDFIYKIDIMIGDNIVQNSDLEGNIYQEFQNFKQNYTIHMGYRLSNFKLYILGGFEKFNIDKDYEDSLLAPDSSQYISTGSMINYSNVKFTNIKMIGLDFRGTYKHRYRTNESDNSHFNSIKVETSYSFIPFYDNIFSLNFSGGYGNNPDILEERISGKTCFKSLPSGKVASGKYSGFSFNYELPLYTNNSISVSGLSFAERGLYKAGDLYNESYYGAGMGLRLYLKGVALPAISLESAYNFNTENYVYSFSIGFGGK